MYKRVSVLFSLLLVASLILAACAPSASPTEAVPEPTEAVTEPTEVMEEPTEAPTEAVEEPAETEEVDTEEPADGEDGEALTIKTGDIPAECEGDSDEQACAVFAPGETIKIGFAGPMTGDFSAFGTDISQGAQIGIQQCGNFGNWQVELLVEDTQGTPEGGASVANLYVSNPDVVAIHGHTFSGSAASAIPIYNTGRRPMLSASATRADLTEGDQDVFNRIAFTDDIQGTRAAEYLFNQLGVTRIAIMHDGDAYGQGLAETVRRVFTELGGEVVAFQAVTVGETDYSAPLTEIAAFAPEAIYFGGYYPEASVIANNMPVAGLTDTILFSDDGTFGSTFIELAGENAEGAYATSALPPASEAVDAFTQAYLDAYGVEPGALSTFTWHGYDVACALSTVIANVAVEGPDGNVYISREAMVAGVRNLTGFQGLTGEITCNESGECNTAGPTFFQVQNGEWVQAAGE